MSFSLSLFRPHLGKIVGAVVGIALGLKLFGLIFGILLGALADILLQELRLRRTLQRNSTDWATEGNVPPELEFIISLSKKVLCAASLDEPPSPTDINYLEEQVLHNFHLTPRGESAVHHFFQSNTEGCNDFYEAERGLSRPVEQAPKEQLAAARLLCEAATLSSPEKHLHHRGKRFIQKSCRSLGIRPEYMKIAAGIVIHQDTTDYEVLGVPADTPTDEIKRVYRTLAGQFHPDSLHGLNPEQKKAATEAFIRIRTAYENIIKAQIDTE